MKYFEVKFNIHCPAELLQDARDLLAAMTGEAGFESFEETDSGLKGYAQQTLFDRDALDQTISWFPLDGTSITYEVGEAEDRDWNEQWEQAGFDPIVIKSEGKETNGPGVAGIVIHDGRHLPDKQASHLPPLASYLSIEIDARQAFGTGTHETTRMVCTALLDLFNTQAVDRVLDCGTGTGILGICALKLGASQAVGYDIDEWSADNARHNAVINRVDDRFESLLGDSSLLNNVEGTFDVVMANINRNILLADMPRFRQKMADGGVLILSGFYVEDVPMLTNRAQELGLHAVRQMEDDNWTCLVLRQE